MAIDNKFTELYQKVTGLVHFDVKDFVDEQRALGLTDKEIGQRLMRNIGLLVSSYTDAYEKAEAAESEIEHWYHQGQYVDLAHSERESLAAAIAEEFGLDSEEEVVEETTEAPTEAPTSAPITDDTEETTTVAPVEEETTTISPDDTDDEETSSASPIEGTLQERVVNALDALNSDSDYTVEGEFTMCDVDLNSTYEIAADKLADNPKAIVNDYARFAGKLHTEAGIDEITFNDVVYTWDDSQTFKGSKFMNGTTTLMSVVTNSIKDTLAESGEAVITLVIDGKPVVTSISVK